MKSIIRNIKIEKREGCVAHIIPLLKKAQIKMGDWLILKAKNITDNKELIFPTNVRSIYRINIRKNIRTKLGLVFDKKILVQFEVIKKLDKIKLNNGPINFLCINLTEVLPNYVKIKTNKVYLLCFKWDNQLIFSYKNSKSSNYIILNNNLVLDPFIVGLWRAEGGKYSLTRSGLQFTNSNLEIVKKWIDYICSLGFSRDDSRISYYIQYISPRRDLKRERNLINYWSDRLDLPKNSFGFIYKTGPGYKAKKHGTIQIKFNNSTLSFIIQYLFMKFEKSLLLEKWDKNIVKDYIKGVMCDCSLRGKSLAEIRFSTSCKNEAELYKKLLFKYFSITSRIFPDKRNKCFYLRLSRWENLLIFLRHSLFDTDSWKGTNNNYNKFKTGIINHLYSKIILSLSSDSLKTDDEITSNLLINEPKSNKHGRITLIKRGINFLISKNFLKKKENKISLSSKGLQTKTYLVRLSALLPR